MWIATRVLVAPNGETLEISVGAPFERDHVWVCPYQYVRNGVAEAKSVEGGDALQALHIALSLISREYGQSEFVWPSTGKHSGLPIIVDGDPELIDHRKLAKVIDDEMERMTAEALARIKGGTEAEWLEKMRAESK
jgi:hypothetical protein